MTRGRWGRAGVRLTEGEARAADVRAGRRRLQDQQALGEAYRRWAAGQLVPARITIALDLHELYGPEVDAACGVAEPDVDRWEAGDLYPTWEQLLALSKITPMVALSFFFLEVGEGDLVGERSTLRFHMPSEEPDGAPVLRFTEEAFSARPTPGQQTLW